MNSSISTFNSPIVGNTLISAPLSAQCLNAVRTVQSLSCLDEADHTVGFLLQLSSFCKEWQFHLPKLLRDIQVSPEDRSTSAETNLQLPSYSVFVSVSSIRSTCVICVRPARICSTARRCFITTSRSQTTHFLTVN